MENPVIKINPVEGQCHECVYYHVEHQTGSGQCRANPPIPLAVPQQDLTGRVTMQIVSVFPPIAADAYCGMFESENAAQADAPPEPH